MRSLAIAFMLFLAAVSFQGAAADGVPRPLRDAIIRNAHVLVARHAPTLAEARFGTTIVDPDGPRSRWTVMGIATDPNVMGDEAEHVYVAEMRLVCDDAEDEICWRIERLGVDFTPVYRAEKLK